MMEESSDESAELVDTEEAVRAEKQFTIQQKNPGITPPAPLPSFLTSPPGTLSQPPVQVTPVSPASPVTTSSVPMSPGTPGSRSTITPTKSLTLTKTELPQSPTVVPVSPPSTGTALGTASIPVTVATSVPSIRPPVKLQEVTPPGMQVSPYEASQSINVAEMDVDTSPMQSPHQAGLFGWLSGNKMISRVVEKTKSSVETMITTLDPGMKEVIKSGGDINILVTSTKESKVSAIREAFQTVFGKATVIGKESQATTAVQPVGFTAGLKGAQERIQNLRQSANIPDYEPVVSVEGFIVEMLPDRWYELSCLVLQDPQHRIDLQTFSQPSPIPAQYILKAQDRTPKDYPLRWAGLAVSIGQVVEEDCPHIGHVDWQGGIVGVSRRESLFLAAKSLAYMYRQRLPTMFVS